MAEEVHLGHSHLGRRPALLALADADELGRVHRGTGAAGGAVGHDAVGDLDALRRPGGDGSRGAEIHVVGMSGHDQHLGRLGHLCHLRRRSSTAGITLVVFSWYSAKPGYRLAWTA